MKKTIIANDRKHLAEIIDEQIQLHGINCNLNHIDISNVKDMTHLFFRSKFNGDISEWDVSHIIDMSYMFKESIFNGDISKWNTLKVARMSGMFSDSKFNSNISEWDVSNVTDMNFMFCNSQFNGDISKWNVENVKSMKYMFTFARFKNWESLFDWKPYSLAIYESMFTNLTKKEEPYWLHYENSDARKKAIDSYQLSRELDRKLTNNAISQPRIKI